MYTHTHTHTHAHTQSNFASCVLMIFMKMIALMKSSGCNYFQIKNCYKIRLHLCSRYACLNGCFKKIFYLECFVLNAGISIMRKDGFGDREMSLPKKNRCFPLNLVLWWLRSTLLSDLSWGMSLPGNQSSVNVYFKLNYHQGCICMITENCPCVSFYLYVCIIWLQLCHYLTFPLE